MKSISTITVYFGLTIVGMLFASVSAWLCTVPYGQTIILVLLAAILLWLFIEADKDSNWKTALFSSVLPISVCTLFIGFIFWCLGNAALTQLETAVPIGLTIIVGTLLVLGFALALFEVFLFFDFLFTLLDGKIKIKLVQHHLFVLFVTALCLATIASTLYFIIYPMCLP